MKNNKKQSKTKLLNLSQSVLNVFKKDANKDLNYKQVCAALGISDTSARNQVIKKIHALKSTGKIEEIDRGSYKLVKAIDYYRILEYFQCL